MDRGVKPILKWAGGKGSILSQLKPLFPQDFNKYYEPFFGGGAVFFSLDTESVAQINDINLALTNLYQKIKDEPKAVISGLRKIEEEYSSTDDIGQKELYYTVRERYNQNSRSTVESAIHFVFLNRTCFNGLYRENKKGSFNVPFGAYKNPRICDEDGICSVSRKLKKCFITNVGFAAAVKDASEGDFVYFDPPYVPLSQTSSFTSYSSGGFGIAEQKELATLYRELDKRGCYVALSNSDTTLVRELYDGFNFHTIEAQRNISARGEKRGKVTELLVTNY